jgi:hypothetical protein
MNFIYVLPEWGRLAFSSKITFDGKGLINAKHELKS